MTTIKSILSRLTIGVSGTEKLFYSEEDLNKFAQFYLDKGMRTQVRMLLQKPSLTLWDTDYYCRRSQYAKTDA
jgi:hypothetical protein